MLHQCHQQTPPPTATPIIVTESPQEETGAMRRKSVVQAPVMDNGVRLSLQHLPLPPLPHQQSPPPIVITITVMETLQEETGAMRRRHVVQAPVMDNGVRLSLQHLPLPPLPRQLLQPMPRQLLPPVHPLQQQPMPHQLLQPMLRLLEVLTEILT